MSRFINNNPSQPWNHPVHRDSPFAPWNNPMRRDNPFEPWNRPFGDKCDMNKSGDKEYLERRGLNCDCREDEE
jgi:hypothetical protein